MALAQNLYPATPQRRAARGGHPVFATKYRWQVLTPRVFETLRRSIARTAQALGLVVEAIEADKDHVHILFAFPPHLALATIAQRIKGASSRFIRQQRFSDVLKKLWGKAFWSHSYCVVSCGGVPLNVVKAPASTDKTPKAINAAHASSAHAHLQHPPTAPRRPPNTTPHGKTRRIGPLWIPPLK